MKLASFVKKIGWLVPCLLCGWMATAASWYVLTGPIWHCEGVVGRPAGFSADGRVLVTAVSNHSPSQVCLWDVETGRELSRRALPNAPPGKETFILPSPDGQRVLIEGSSLSTPTGSGLRSWCLYDHIDGHVVAQYGDQFEPVAVPVYSSTGRWFHGRATYGYPTEYGLGIWSTVTGLQTICLFQNGSGLYPRQVVFAPNEASAVVLYGPHRSSTARTYAIAMVELPSGRFRLLHNVPERPWTKIEYWDGNRLEMTAQFPTLTSRSTYYQCTFLVNGESLSSPTDESTTIKEYGRDWTHGATWRAYFEIPSPGLWQDFVACLHSWGVPLPLGPGNVKLIARIEDKATGRVRELSRLVRQGCILSADGRRLACQTDSDGIEMWDIDPPPRWPWVTGAAIAGFLLPLGARRGALGLKGWRPAVPNASATSEPSRSAHAEKN